MRLRSTCFPHLQSQAFNQVRLIICVNRLKSTVQTTDHVIESDLRQLMITLPSWASLLTNVNVKEGFVNGFVADSDVDKVLELHGRECLTDYIKR